jgi:excisionase family DNA binding protein
MRLISVAEACDRLNIGRTSFYELVKSGFVPVKKIGRRSVVREDELHAAIEQLPSSNRKGEAQ